MEGDTALSHGAWEAPASEDSSTPQRQCSDPSTVSKSQSLTASAAIAWSLSGDDPRQHAGSSCGSSQCCSRGGSRGSYLRRGGSLARRSGSGCGTGSRGGGSRCGSRCASRASQGSRCASRAASRASSRLGPDLLPRLIQPSDVESPVAPARSLPSMLRTELLASVTKDEVASFGSPRKEPVGDNECPGHLMPTDRPKTESTRTPPTTQGTCEWEFESPPRTADRHSDFNPELEEFESALKTAESEDGCENPDPPADFLRTAKRRTYDPLCDDGELHEDDVEEEEEHEHLQMKPVPQFRPKCGRCSPVPIDGSAIRYPNRFVHQLTKTSWLKIAAHKNHDTAQPLPHWHSDLDRFQLPPQFRTVFNRKKHPVFRHFTNRKLYHLDNQLLQTRVKTPMIKEFVATFDDGSGTLDLKYRAMKEDLELSRMRMIVGKKARNRTFEDTVALVGYLKKRRFFKDLQIDLLHKIGTHLEVKRFEPNEVLWRENQKVQGIHVLLKGELSYEANAAHGRRRSSTIDVDEEEPSLYVVGERVLGIRELVMMGQGPVRLKKYAKHTSTAIAAKVVESLFIDKEILNTLIEHEAMIERLAALRELWPETIGMTHDDLFLPSAVEKDERRVTLHRLFCVEVYPAQHHFFERGQKLPWDLAKITLIIDGLVELQLGSRVSVVGRGTVIGKEPLTGDAYHFTAVASDTVRVMQIGLQDYAQQWDAQNNMIIKMKERAKEAQHAMQEQIEHAMQEQNEAPVKQELSMNLSFEAWDAQHNLNQRSIGPQDEGYETEKKVRIGAYSIRDLQLPIKRQADIKVVHDLYPHVRFKKIPPRRMPPVERPRGGGRVVTEVIDDFADVPTIRQELLKRSAQARIQEQKAQARTKDSCPTNQEPKADPKAEVTDTTELKPAGRCLVQAKVPPLRLRRLHEKKAPCAEVFANSNGLHVAAGNNPYSEAVVR